LKSEEKGKYSNIKNHILHHIVLHKVGPYGGPRFHMNKFFIESSNKFPPKMHSKQHAMKNANKMYYKNSLKR
jgi:hypothetical protein